MAPPSQIEIATSSVLRLVKEESSYRKELQGQLSRIEKLERDGGDENFDFQLKQEVRIDFTNCLLELWCMLANLGLLCSIETGS